MTCAFWNTGIPEGMRGYLCGLAAKDVVFRFQNRLRTFQEVIPAELNTSLEIQFDAICGHGRTTPSAGLGFVQLIKPVFFESDLLSNGA